MQRLNNSPVVVELFQLDGLESLPHRHLQLACRRALLQHLEEFSHVWVGRGWLVTLFYFADQSWHFAFLRHRDWVAVMVILVSFIPELFDLDGLLGGDELFHSCDIVVPVNIQFQLMLISKVDD